ncbi:hypothetical protein Q7P37_006832 [Cladosporium fusiforme]
MQSLEHKGKPALISFSAANEDYRYLRKRASILCDAFNAQKVDVSHEDRCQAWNAIIDPSNKMMATECPTIKGPIHIDYGVNLHVHHTCFINRDCYIADSPEIDISIGANTLVSVGVRLLGCGVIVLPGVTIGDGCVVGAGSVVTNSVPSYHVAFGNPARIFRKVAPDVADAAGSVYVVDGDRMVLADPLSSERERHAEKEPPWHGKSLQEEDGQVARETRPVKGGMPGGVELDGKTVLHIGIVLLPFCLGYWFGGLSS